MKPTLSEMPQGAEKILGWEDYWVTRGGEVYTERYRKMDGVIKKVSQIVIPPGYVHVSLWNEGEEKRKFCLVHRLVAGTFIPNPEKLREVDHINGDKEDNRVENLRWVSHRENIGMAMARMGNWLAKAPRKKVGVVGVDEVSKERREFGSMKEAGEWLVKAGWLGRSGRVSTAMSNVSSGVRLGVVRYGHRWEKIVG